MRRSAGQIRGAGALQERLKQHCHLLGLNWRCGSEGDLQSSELSVVGKPSRQKSSFEGARKLGQLVTAGFEFHQGRGVTGFAKDSSPIPVEYQIPLRQSHPASECRRQIDG